MISKRETDGRFALKLNSRQSVVRFEKKDYREKQREARRAELIQNALNRGLTVEQAEEEVYLFA